MTFIDKIHQIMWRAESTRCGIISRSLISPRTIIRMLNKGHNFNMCKLMFHHIRNEFFCHFPVRIQRSIFFLFPRTEMQFINCHRFFINRFFFSYDSSFIIPFVSLYIKNYRCRIRSYFCIYSIRICLKMTSPAVVSIAYLYISFLQYAV